MHGRSAVMKLYKLCPCYTGYVIVTNTVTLVHNELDRLLRARIRSSVRARARMHLDSREFACVHTHKCKLIFCVRGLVRAFARGKKSQNSNLGSETFMKYYVYTVHVQYTTDNC